MCINEPVSWITLALGTLFSILFSLFLWKTVKEWRVAILMVWAWQYGLLMQLPEAMVWRTQGSAGWQVLAYVLNATQPHATLFFSAAAMRVTRDTYDVITKLSRRATDSGLIKVVTVLRVLLPMSALTLYTVYLGFHTPKCDFAMLVPACENLVLSWWEGCLGVEGGCLFLGAILVTFLCMLPMGWALGLSMYFMITHLISFTYYKCSWGSMWCWLVVFANFFIVAMALVFDRFDYPCRSTAAPSTDFRKHLDRSSSMRPDVVGVTAS